MRLPRSYHRFRAWATGYFWHPCPRCGRMFGGHEKGGGMDWHGTQNEWGETTCPDCPGDKSSPIYNPDGPTGTGAPTPPPEGMTLADDKPDPARRPDMHRLR